MIVERTVRPSSLTTFADCGRRWASRHLADEISAAGYRLRTGLSSHVGAAVGTGVHAAAAYSLHVRLQSGGSLGRDADAEEQGILAFRDRAAAEMVDWDGTTPDSNTAEAQIRRMSRAWRRSEAAESNPLQVEERLEAEFAPGWRVSGQLDLLAGDPDQIVRDTKTGTRRRANGVQYGAYGMIWRAWGYRPKGVIEDYLQRVALAKEQPPVQSHPIDIVLAQREAFEVLEAVRTATAEFERRLANPNGRPPEGAFRPNPASALCSARFCPAWGTEFCRAHA
jgi:hypothetical protein